MIEPSDRVLIVNGEEEIYRGYVGLMRYHKFELDKYLDIDVLKIREKTEIWHKDWKERGLTAMMIAGTIMQVLLSAGTGSAIAGIGIIAGAAVKRWGE